MSVPLSFWVQIGIGLSILVASILVLILVIWWGNKIEHRRSHHRPIICICEVNGRIGVVLRRDYDEASRRYWKQYYDGKNYDSGHIAAPDGCRLEVEPLFNFKAWSPEYYQICYGCYVERAIFYVPAVGKDQSSEIAEAYQYFHGKPWDGRITPW